MSDPFIEPPSRETNTWATFTHLSALSGFIGVPFGHIVGPLVMWLIKRDDNPTLDAHGKEALNFNISMVIYAIVSVILMLVLIGFVLIFAVALIALILPIIAAIKANKGELYRYPLTIRFIS